MTLTLENIARLSGVSRSTVSRVINNHPNVRDEVRERVMKIIQETGYQPNLTARSLAAGRTRVIGLVIPAGVSTIFTDPYFPLLIQGISAACNVHDYSVMLWLAEPEYERRTIRQILHGGLLDGVVVASTLMDDPIVNSLHESQMPFILIGRHPTLDVNYVDVDNFQAGRDATQHLLRLGRKGVATVTGPQNMIAGSDRYQGYLRALQDRNQPFHPELVTEGDFTEEGGYQAMLQLIPTKPDAVFVASDTMAIGALRALREAELLVPDDIALVSHDDMPIASKVNPPLTTIRQQPQHLGSVAVNTLINVIQHPGSASRHVTLATELVIRSSCGAISE